MEIFRTWALVRYQAYPKPLLVLENDVVNDAILLTLLGIHDEITFDVALDLFQPLPGVFRDQLTSDFPHSQDLARVNVNFRRLSRKSRHERLVDQNTRSRKRKTFLGCSRR